MWLKHTQIWNKSAGKCILPIKTCAAQPKTLPHIARHISASVSRLKDKILKRAACTF